MATLRKRGSKWHVQIRRSGQSQTQSFNHKADAEVWARKIEREFDQGLHQRNLEKLKIRTVADLLRCYRDKVVSKNRSAWSIE